MSKRHRPKYSLDALQRLCSTGFITATEFRALIKAKVIKRNGDLTELGFSLIFE